MSKMSLAEAEEGYEQLMTRLEEITEAVKQFRDTTKETISLFPAAVLPCDNEEETRKAARYFYWNCPEITSQAIKDALGWPNKPSRSLPDYVGPYIWKIQCKKCDGPLEVRKSSRSDYPQTEKCRVCLLYIHILEKLKQQQIQSSKINCSPFERDCVTERVHTESGGNWTVPASTGYEWATSMPYAEYLQTEHWKTQRTYALKCAGFKCQVCNQNGQLNVHHRTYERLGCERDNDLIVLCQDCHAKFHDKLEAQES